MVVGALAAHAATNLANDYGDHRSRNDELNRVTGSFNGGSRFTQTGLPAGLVDFLILPDRDRESDSVVWNKYMTTRTIVFIIGR